MSTREGRPRRRRAHRATALAMVAWLVGAAVDPGGAGALRAQDPDVPPDCPTASLPQVVLDVRGLPVRGNSVTIDASTAKIVALTRTCEATLIPLPANEVRWELTRRPAGSSAALTVTSSLQARLLLDRVGTFEVSLTACPGGCSVAGHPDAPEVTRSVAIDAVDALAVPPETEPVAPTDRPTSPTSIDDQCPTFADFLNAAWLTVEPWTGADDYELLEGVVTESRISSTDNDSNHDSMDVNVVVQPDPSYRRLLGAGQNGLEIEWERSSYPEAFRPLRGDRVSAVGYWIYDCAHDSKTEIHPPILLAAHRARPIELPTSLGLGSGLQVPGIITDIWVSADAGGVTGDCARTGLHEQGGGGGADLGPHECLPQTKGFDRSPIDREYTFRIYLPRNPAHILEAVGATVPPVPVSVAIEDPLGGGGPDPEIVPNDTADPTWLDVTLDLRGYGARSYSRRIVAGWAYPSPDNWGLQRWKVRVSSMDVSDDHDNLSDGDWRFWILTNNGTHEWTKLYDCGGCVHGTEHFGGVPWQTGSPDPNRSLGPDILAFPGQRLYVQTTGFEDDIEFEDRIGAISKLLPQEARQYDEVSSDDGDYTLSFEVLEGAAVASPQLSAAGRALYDAYEISADDGAPGKLPIPPQRLWNHPDVAVLKGDDPVPMDETDYFEPPNHEPLAIDDIPAEAFRDQIGRARVANPAVVEALLDGLRDRMAGDIEAQPGEVRAALEGIREATPPDLWRTHFADLYDGSGQQQGAEEPLAWVALGILAGLAAALVALVAAAILRRRSSRRAP